MSIELLRKFGMYVDESFLSKETCSCLRAEMETSTFTKAGLFNKRGELRQDFDLRQTLIGRVSKGRHGEVLEKVVSLKTKLEAHFSDSYSDIVEEPKYLVYRKDHFFAPHRDDQIGRKINLSIYLNDEMPDAETHSHSYSGGALKIYGLMKGPGMEKWGVSLRGQAGLLIAYPADVVHEVTPITQGTRYAIVARYMEPKE